MPFLNSPLLYVIAFLAVTNIVSSLGWKAASSEANEQKQKVVACQARHDAFVGQVRAQGDLAKEKAKAKEIENARIADETGRSWAAALSAVRADYAARLRNAAASRGAGGGGLSAPAEDRPGNAETRTDPIPAPERLAADCAETTVTANYLQSYIERIEQ